MAESGIDAGEVSTDNCFLDSLNLETLGYIVAARFVYDYPLLCVRFSSNVTEFYRIFFGL